MNKSVDDWLLGHKTRAVRTQDSGGFLFGRKKSPPPLKPGYGLTNLRAAALKQPEVMVKITRRKSNAGNGLKGIRNHLDYISRNGEVEVENQDGEKLNGKKALRNQTKDWQKLGIPENGKRREALNIVLSMPAGTPPQAVKDAAREFAAEQFQGHQYTFALHTDSERPDEPAHPHVHLCVLMRDEFGQRLNPRKDDLFEWRLRFAEKMREQGVPCAATRRQHRGVTRKGENFVLHSMRKRGYAGNVHKEQAKTLIEAIKTGNRPAHIFLKEAVATRSEIVSEYAKIARELYKSGHKTEARLLSKFAKKVNETGFTTQAQAIFDKSVHDLYQSQSQNINVADIER
jgi:hypothetical protein